MKCMLCKHFMPVNHYYYYHLTGGCYFKSKQKLSKGILRSNIFAVLLEGHRRNFLNI